MNVEKQIEELAEGIFLNCPACLFEDEAKMIAEFVINEQGYRKAEDIYKDIYEGRIVIIKTGLEQAIAYEKNTWVITENGCVITCPNCGERLELCYPDGTEVRYLPHCPWCGKKLEKGE